MTRFKITSNWPLAAVLTGMLSLPGCVILDSPEKIAQVEETNDPFEPANRYIFEVNRFLDELLFKPTATWYRIGLPDPVQDSVRNAMSNLRMPWTAINDFFQGQLERALVAVARFFVNSTFGVLGLFEVAAHLGLPLHEEDSGQTFAVMGMPEGAYLVLPVFGPSNVRDAFGTAIDYFVDPINLIARHKDNDTLIPAARSTITAIDTRARNIETVEELERGAVDYYARVRSVVRQRRDSEIRNRAPGANFPGPAVSQGTAAIDGPTPSALK
ncbi:MAG: MlaA family lipoprotein [Pseudomonadota bacterium]